MFPSVQSEHDFHTYFTLMKAGLAVVYTTAVSVSVSACVCILYYIYTHTHVNVYGCYELMGRYMNICVFGYIHTYIHTRVDWTLFLFSKVETGRCIHDDQASGCRYSLSSPRNPRTSRPCGYTYIYLSVCIHTYINTDTHTYNRHIYSSMLISLTL